MKWVAAVLSGTAAASGVHPIEKIVTLLQGLATKSESEGKDEAVAYTKFEYWCKNSIKSLKAAIDAENETIDILTSKIDSKTKEEAALTQQISALTDELGKLSVDKTNAQTIRTSTNALFTKALADTTATKVAMEQIIVILKTSQTPAFVQETVRNAIGLLETRVTDEQRQTLEDFVNQPAPAGSRQGAIKKYSFKGGGALELIKELLIKFEDDIVRLNAEETDSLNSFTLSKKAQAATIAAATASKTEKQAILAVVQSKLATAKGDLTNTKGDLTSDTATLSSTEKSCSVKKSEWAERCAIRSNEIEAIQAAIKILAKVGGVRTAPPNNPIPPSSPIDFLQTSKSDDPKMKAVLYLRQQAKVLHAKSLARLAQQLSTHLGDPFAEVTNMIEKMVFQLMAEQKDEDDHKNWCDLELSKTAASISDKSDKVAELSAKIADGTASVNSLTEDIKDANEMIADIVAFMNEATEIRQIGKQENALAIKDSEDAQTAVANAIAVLTEFYKSSGEIAKQPYEFIQSHAPAVLPGKPSTWAASYTGVSDPDAQPGGIISILDACNTDFAEMEADTRAQEASDQDAFNDDASENAIEKAKRSKEVEMKTNEKKRLVDKINELTKTKKHVADELEATRQYNKDLQPACVDGDSTYADRKAARTKEIEALHKAEDILAQAFKAGSASFLERKQISRA